MNNDSQQIKEKRKARRQKRQADNTSIVMWFVGDIDYDLDAEEIAAYHLRLTGKGKVLDYFPQTGRATWLRSNKWFTISDIEIFIMENFKA